MNIPDELYYTKEHEWIRVEGQTATVGITDHAQEQLGDITYVELPEPGTAVSQNGELATVESVKAASDVYSPVAGTISSVNEALEDAPERINSDPYGTGWLCTLSGITEDQLSALMNAAEYGAFVAQEE